MSKGWACRGLNGRADLQEEWVIMSNYANGMPALARLQFTLSYQRRGVSSHIPYQCSTQVHLPIQNRVESVANKIQGCSILT